MVIGLGTDLCENARILRLYNRYGRRFLERVFTEEEIEYCFRRKDPIPHLSGRFALKEAFIKALGMRHDLALSYREIGLSGGKGKKDLIVFGQIKNLYEERADRMLFSISHARGYSSAVVVLEKNHV